MERKARRAYRSVLDLVVATCTAALVGAMSVVPPDPRRVAGVVPSASRPCHDVICTGESRRRQRSDVRLRSQRRRVVSGAQQMYLPRTRRGSCDPAEWTAAHRATCCVPPSTRRGRSCLWKAPRCTFLRKWSKSRFCNASWCHSEMELAINKKTLPPCAQKKSKYATLVLLLTIVNVFHIIIKYYSA